MNFQPFLPLLVLDNREVPSMLVSSGGLSGAMGRVQLGCCGYCVPGAGHSDSGVPVRPTLACLRARARELQELPCCPVGWTWGELLPCTAWGGKL